MIVRHDFVTPNGLSIMTWRRDHIVIVSCINPGEEISRKEFDYIPNALNYHFGLLEQMRNES